MLNLIGLGLNEIWATENDGFGGHKMKPKLWNLESVRGGHLTVGLGLELNRVETDWF